jgi:hypothetical protein
MKQQSLFTGECHLQLTDPIGHPAAVLHGFPHTSLKYPGTVTYIKSRLFAFGNEDNAAGLESVYRLDGRGAGVRVPVGARLFSSSCCPA